MKGPLGKIAQAFEPMKYGSLSQRIFYRAIIVGAVLVPILILAIVGGLIYANINGIEISFPI